MSLRSRQLRSEPRAGLRRAAAASAPSSPSSPMAPLRERNRPNIPVAAARAKETPVRASRRRTAEAMGMGDENSTPNQAKRRRKDEGEEEENRARQRKATPGSQLSAVRALRSPDRALRSPERSSPKSPERVLRSPLKSLGTPVKAQTSPVKALRSPVKTLRSPMKTPRSPAKALASPVKAPKSPVKALSSPVKTPRSPIKALRSPTKNPRSPSKAASSPATFSAAAYSRAKMSLSTAFPSVLIGRKEEVAAMEDFLAKAWTDTEKSKSAHKKSLYVSGAPGTGKTASLSYLLEKKHMSKSHKVVFINCMSLRTSGKVFGEIARAVDPNFDSTNESVSKKHLEAHICSRKGKPVLLVLDEVDQLGSKEQQVLYTLFELPHLKGSRLALVAIANSLDLTDRILPRLKSAVTVAPLQLSFPAYTRTEIHDIITSRLVGEAVIKPAAVKFLAGKISSVSGDIRKALDVCRRAIEMGEMEHRRNRANGLPPKQIEMGQILKIFNEVYSSRVTASLTSKAAESDLPLQQKLLMATLLRMSCYGPRKCKEVSLGKLHESYARVCKRRGLGSGLDLAEIRSLCSLLEARGFFALRGGGASVRETKISLRIDEREVEQALQDQTLLNNVLKDAK